MSKYTTELRHIVSNGNVIFDFDYEFYQADKKEEFQQHFIKHFFFREIGLETVEMFKRYLELKFIEVLPFYNEMFKTVSLTYDPIVNYDIVEKIKKDNTGNVTTDLTGKVIQAGTGKITEDSSLIGKVTLKNDIKDTGTVTTDNTTTDTGNVTTLNTTTDTGTVSNTNTSKDTGTKTDSGNTTGSSIDNSNTTGNVNKAHSDTPQGSTSITSTSFVSDLNREDNTGTIERDITTEGTNTNTMTNDLTKTDTGTITNDLSKTDNGTVTNNLTKEDNGTITNDLTKAETGETNTTNTGTGETNTTQDATTDTTNKVLENKTGNENAERTIKGLNGNITATELIERHLQLQRKLKTVELQFFEECNDLFILLW